MRGERPRGCSSGQRAWELSPWQPRAALTCPVWAGAGSSCAPWVHGEPAWDADGHLPGARLLYWGAACSSPGQRPEVTWGRRGSLLHGGGGIQPLLPSVCGSGAGDWAQVQTRSVGGDSSGAEPLASEPHPRPTSDTLPQATGSRASGGCLWMGSGCPSHLLAALWWPLSLCYSDQDPRLLSGSLTRSQHPAASSGHEAATLTSR